MTGRVTLAVVIFLDDDLDRIEEEVADVTDEVELLKRALFRFDRDDTLTISSEILLLLSLLLDS